SANYSTFLSFILICFFFFIFFFLMIPRPPISTLFPYTTLFRSYELIVAGRRAGQRRGHDKGEHGAELCGDVAGAVVERDRRGNQDRKSTRLNSSHVKISYAVFCLKKKKKKKTNKIINNKKK